MFESAEAAAEALAASVQSDNQVTDSEQAAAVTTPDTDAGATETTQQDVATVEDSFTSIDPDSLPEELKPLWKQLQGDYTRKTQEVAPYRQLGVSADEAREALTLAQNLQDPDFQKQLYDRLSQHYGEDDLSGFEDDGFDDPRDRQLQDLSTRIEQFERRQVESQISAELDRAEAAIRSSNPSWTDDDIESVAQLALSHNGDMMKASETYKALNDRFINRHMDRKAQVPAGASAPGSTAGAQVPTKFDSFEDAHKAALQYIAANAE